jgi:hypothetical protein
LPGFGYRLRRSGDKVNRSWVAQYRHAGQTRRITLGAGSVLNADQARGEAKRILAQAALKQDPASERKRKAAADKFTLVVWPSSIWQPRNRKCGVARFTEAQRYLQGLYFKPLHNMPVDTITRRDIAARGLVISRENGAVAAGRARAAPAAAKSPSGDFIKDCIAFAT